MSSSPSPSQASTRSTRSVRKRKVKRAIWQGSAPGSSRGHRASRLQGMVSTLCSFHLVMGLLQGKVVLITGASRGIGAVSARLFAAEGARLVLGARSDEPLQAVARALREGGIDVVATAADVTTRDGSERLVDAALRHHGRLDGAFDNAAAGHPPLGPLTSNSAVAAWTSPMIPHRECLRLPRTETAGRRGRRSSDALGPPGNC